VRAQWPESALLLALGLAAGTFAAGDFWPTFGIGIAALALGAAGTLATLRLPQLAALPSGGLLLAGAGMAAMATLARGAVSEPWVTAIAWGSPFLAAALPARLAPRLLMVVALMLALLGPSLLPPWATQPQVDLAIVSAYLVLAGIRTARRPSRMGFLSSAMACGALAAASSVSTGLGIGPWPSFVGGLLVVGLGSLTLVGDVRRRRQAAASHP
jgi:hypothetical protein